MATEMKAAYQATTFGRALREARRQRGWRREELAHACGVSVDSVTGWEQDRKRPRGDHMLVILNELFHAWIPFDTSAWFKGSAGSDIREVAADTRCYIKVPLTRAFGRATPAKMQFALVIRPVRYSLREGGGGRSPCTLPLGSLRNSTYRNRRC